MTNSPIALVGGKIRVPRPFLKGALLALLAGCLSVSLPVATTRAQPASDEAEGGEVLTRGPVHEAFAGVVSYNPKPGIVVKTRPPELIEEIPPEEKPEGDDVAWIPGYWGWDDERNDFIWISGTWRAVPPGREWMAGYWRETGDGYQWISGYWAGAEARETTYLPPPPETLEVGPNIDAPSPDYGWTPGCWEWRQSRYAWRAGYWAPGRADWVWVPAYYVWTPRGVIFVDGYWDYVVTRRGLLFAPVYYRSHAYYARRDYRYSPRIVINVSIFDDCLFLRPSYHHYYFGDYYDSRYDRSGFYASFTFQSSRRGFDPFYAHSRWEHRSDRGWENRSRASYQDRRDHEAARPPRTWSAQQRDNSRPPAGGPARVPVATPLKQLASRQDNAGRFQPVAREDRQRFSQRGREVQESRDQRRTVEAQAAVTPGPNATGAVEPARVAAPRSPIVGRPGGPRGRNFAPPPAQPAPQPNSQVQPGTDSPARPSNADRRNPAAENRSSQSDRNARPDRRGTGSRGPETGASAPNTPQNDAAVQVEQARQQASEAAAQAQQQVDDRAKAAAASGREELQRRTQEAQQQAEERSRRQAGVRGNDSTRPARAGAQPRANESEVRARQDAEQAQAQAESRRQVQELQQQARQEADRTNRLAEENARTAERSRQQVEERASNAARQMQEEAQQRANEAAAQARQAAEQAKAAAARTQPEPERRPPESRERAQPNDERRDRDAAPRSKPPPKDQDDDDSRRDRSRDR